MGTLATDRLTDVGREAPDKRNQYAKLLAFADVGGLILAYALV